MQRLFLLQRGLAPLVLVLAAVGTAFSEPAPGRPALTLYLTPPGGSEIWAVDAETGDRVVHDLSNWPVVMAVNRATVLPDGMLLVEGTHALQLRNLLRFNPADRTLAGVSGLVEPDSPTPRGVGPNLEPGSTALLALPGGPLVFLRRGAGPMLVEPWSGDRSVLSQSVDPPAGSGFPLSAPVDLVIGPDGSILVTDAYEGIVRVSLSDGRRDLLHPGIAFVEPPLLLDILPDGRLVHAHGLDSSNAVYVFDPATARDEVLSGPARGRGPQLAAISDLVLAPDGRLYVLDSSPPTLLAIDVATGDRTVVSGGPELRGAGPDLPTPARLATFSPAHRGSEPRLVHRRLPRAR